MLSRVSELVVENSPRTEPRLGWLRGWRGRPKHLREKNASSSLKLSERRRTWNIFQFHFWRPIPATPETGQGQSRKETTDRCITDKNIRVPVLGRRVGTSVQVTDRAGLTWQAGGWAQKCQAGWPPGVRVGDRWFLTSAAGVGAARTVCGEPSWGPGMDPLDCGVRPSNALLDLVR